MATCAGLSGRCRLQQQCIAVIAAGRVINPCFESWEDLDADGWYDKAKSFFDCGCDRVCPEDEAGRLRTKAKAMAFFRRSGSQGLGMMSGHRNP